jgi:hypothetical protein
MGACEVSWFPALGAAGWLDHFAKHGGQQGGIAFTGIFLVMAPGKRLHTCRGGRV